MTNPAYIVTEIEITYRNVVRNKDRPQILGSQDAYACCLNIWDDNKIDMIEEAKILLLNRSNRVLGAVHLSSGGVSGTVVDPKLVFGAALKANASALILAHNHPSGHLKPSFQDEIITKQIYEAGKLLTLALADHLIISRDGYFSFADSCGL